ncbi:23466_t:CDS:2 [Dentiscutata erythropus]|uniref:23466_t:CDS:1 n=1 Tax=Dentiscutata erythropus TaxID=1348616 RepID=A0A9N9CVX2_9GLOM|nr:23466_t:CDS:2 [Dentiscutata erythropus]
MGVKLDKPIANAKSGFYTFQIRGGIYHSIGSLLPSDGIPRDDNNLDQRVYNKPTASQAAAIWVEGNDHISCTERDIIVQSRSQGLQRGDYGWHPNIFQNMSNEKVTARQYYAYKLHFREPLSLLFFGGQLFQQYIVDNYVKIESARFNYLRFTQHKICKKHYQGLQDSFQSGITNASDIGQKVLLLSSFIGGSHNMYQRYQDTMTLVQTFGKPDVFITITCNPRWPEITTELMPMQTPQDRPDLTVQVTNKDEISQYLDTRWVSASESCWRIFGFDLSQINPSILRLQIHLSDKQNITYPESSDITNILADEQNKKTMLTEYFEVNKVDSEARNYTYREFPQHYVWNKTSKKWTKRKQKKNDRKNLYCQPK